MTDHDIILALVAFDVFVVILVAFIAYALGRIPR